MNEEAMVKFSLTYGDHGVRFAGPDLLDYVMILKIEGDQFDGERIRVKSSYHPCCGTLDVTAGLMGIYMLWRNKLDGCEQHRREGMGERLIGRLINMLNNS